MSLKGNDGVSRNEFLNSIADFKHVPLLNGISDVSGASGEMLSQKNFLVRIPWNKRADVGIRQSYKNRGCKAPAIPEDNSDGRKAGRDYER